MEANGDLMGTTWLVPLVTALMGHSVETIQANGGYKA